MSVIAGLIRFSGEPVAAADLASAAARVAAPGVKEAKFWAEGPAALVVCQRIVTPEDLAERQPWVGGGGKLVLVYDGRLDNREELAAALNISLTQCETVPDGLLLLRALERWGEAALPRCIGDFALALWDKQNRRLLLARDQMGSRALYYHQGAGFVAFATSYRALLALPGVPKKIDELGIADFLIFNWNHPVTTLYQDVRRVPMASIAVFDHSGLRLHRYWTPDPERRLRLGSDQEYAEAAREQLERAVACRLRALAPVASAMSGGLDSSAIAITAARLLAPKRLLTVTSVPPEDLDLPPQRPGWHNDERPYVQAIAALYPNIDLVLADSRTPHWLEIDPTPFFDAGGLPASNPNNIGWLAPGYQRVSEAGGSVLLDGVGGNSVWSWDGRRSLADLFRRGQWLRLARELYLCGRRDEAIGRNWQALVRGEILSPLLPPTLKQLRRRLRTGAELWSDFIINPDFADEIGLFQRYSSARDIHSPNSLKLRLLALDRQVHRGDFSTPFRALTGIERRFPLLDIRLLAFCLAIPDEQYLKDGVQRRLPRLALADRLPSAVLEKDRMGMQNPEILHRLQATRHGLIDEIEALKQVPLAVRCIDLPRLARIALAWELDPFKLALPPRALHVARFLRWAEQGNL